MLDALDEVEARTILLIAPAGYGKTTLARQWLEHAGGAWVTVTAASSDVPVLARDLAGAIGTLAGLDVRLIETALRLGKTPTEQATAVARTILGQVDNEPGGWIVIDDYHLIEPRSASEELIARIERSGRFKLLVTSRARPSWATSRRRIYLETVEFGASDLALDETEVTQLLPPDRRTSALRKQAHGWPAVIGLASRLHLSDVSLDREVLTATLYDYFAEELFERSSPEVRRGLTSLAVLPELDSAELPDLVDVSLASLLETGLATEVNGMVGVHPLAKRYLLTKLEEQSGSDALRDVAFELALSRGLYDHAFELIAELQMHDRLERLIIASYVGLVETGRIATLVRFGSVRREARRRTSARSRPGLGGECDSGRASARGVDTWNVGGSGLARRPSAKGARLPRRGESRSFVCSPCGGTRSLR